MWPLPLTCCSCCCLQAGDPSGQGGSAAQHQHLSGAARHPHAAPPAVRAPVQSEPRWVKACVLLACVLLAAQYAPAAPTLGVTCCSRSARPVTRAPVQSQIGGAKSILLWCWHICSSLLLTGLQCRKELAFCNAASKSGRKWVHELVTSWSWWAWLPVWPCLLGVMFSKWGSAASLAAYNPQHAFLLFRRGAFCILHCVGADP